MKYMIATCFLAGLISFGISNATSFSQETLNNANYIALTKTKIDGKTVYDGECAVLFKNFNTGGWDIQNKCARAYQFAVKFYGIPTPWSSQCLRGGQPQNTPISFQASYPVSVFQEPCNP